MLKQTAHRMEIDDALVLPKGRLVDLGSFENLVYDHDTTRSCEIAPLFTLPVQIALPDGPDELRGPAYEVVLPPDIGFTQHLAIEMAKFAASPNGWKASVGVGVRATLDELAHTIRLSELTFFFGDTTLPLYRLSASDTVRHSLPPSYIKHNSTEVWHPTVRDPDGKPRFTPRPDQDKLTWSPASPFAHYVDQVVLDERSMVWDHLFRRISDPSISGVAGRYNREDMMKDIRESLDHTKLRLRNLSLDYAHDWTRKEPFGDDLMSGLLGGGRDELLPDLAEVSIEVTAGLRDLLNRVRYIGPLREPPDRHSIFGGVSHEDVGTTGVNLADVLFERGDLVTRVNEALESFDIGYKVEIESFTATRDDGHSSGRKDLFSVSLVDQRTGVRVNLPDVGFGVGQVLPVIVQSVLSENNVVLIEQPELHLHPRLQTELGDVFIRSALERGNTFLLETHSEHLILRLMRRMRDTARGTLPKDFPAVHPKDVKILYVQPTENGSVIRELELDEEGELLDPWPNGFFEEGFRERFARGSDYAL